MNVATRSPAPVPEIPIDELLTRFEVEDPEAVRSFLFANPLLLFPLRESVPHVEAAFGDSVSVALEPVVDPESDDSPVLCALIAFPGGNIDEAEERLRRFRRGWWYTARPRTSETLIFDVEMR